MSKQLLSEMFGIIGIPALREDDEIDRINKQLSTAKSVAGGDGSGPTRLSPRGHDQRRQGELDQSTSIFKKEAAAVPGGLQLTGDKETLGALQECLQEAEHSAGDPDLASWAGKAWKAVAAGIRGNGSVTLPKFEQAPEDLMPDEEPGEEF